MGKLSSDALRDMLRCIKRTSKVIVPPMAGFDSGVHKIDEDTCMVVTTDPCLGAPKEWFGWFLIHYAASDVAVFGARPEYVAVNLLGPPETAATVFKRIMRQACKAADELGISIITGHTGTYDGLSTIVGTCTAYGFVQKNKLITPAGAKPGDSIICVKPIGLETITNFALVHKKQVEKLLGPRKAKFLASQIKLQTCVEEALFLSETGGAHAMHDATEGGFVAALNEIAGASNMGFIIDFDLLPISSELKTLAKHLKLSRKEVMSTSSTGTLLAAVAPEKEEDVIGALSGRKITAKKVGHFTRGKKRLIKYDERQNVFPKEPNDPYARMMSL